MEITIIYFSSLIALLNYIILREYLKGLEQKRFMEFRAKWKKKTKRIMEKWHNYINKNALICKFSPTWTRASESPSLWLSSSRIKASG